MTAILDNTVTEAELWSALQELQGQTFLTTKGLPFTFVIRGNELFVSRKDKSITRATVNVAFRHITQLQSDGLHIAGPKKLGTFGASYLYPIFVMLGLIIREHSDGVKNDMISSNTCISSEVVYNKEQKTTGGVMYMPRKKKTTEKVRKPYPTYEERIAAADQTIERLTKLNEERAALIARTEAQLAERRSALDKSQVALEKAKAKKERLVAAMNKPVKEPAPKLTPEERAERRKEALAKAREAKRAEKEKYDALMAALAENGKTIDELLDGLKK